MATRKLTPSDAALRAPAPVWVETRLGISFAEVDQRWVRAKSMTVTEAVNLLAAESGRSKAACGKALRDLLLVSSVPERERTGDPSANENSFYSFKAAPVHLGRRPHLPDDRAARHQHHRRKLDYTRLAAGLARPYLVLMR